MTLRAGQEAVVRTAVATLWTTPEQVRPVDLPALAPRVDIPAWITGMDADQRVGANVLSQLLLGERVLIEEIRPDGWARLIAVEQPAPRLDPRGYPGWLPVDQLVPVSEDLRDEEPLVVDATVTHLHDGPDGPVALRDVVLGTRLTPTGAARQGWRPVRVPGRSGPLWARDSHLVPPPSHPPAAVEVLAIARRLLDVPYIWGGVSAYGLDCSGLVHLAWRRFGVRLPRDADDQARATTALPPGTERPGDLYFFARPGRPIHHVGIVTAEPDPDAERRMLHACYTQRRVLAEPMSAERAATLVGAHRV